MKIDRERFLVLTAALAMGVALAPAGCATEPQPQAPRPLPPPPPAPAPTVIYVMVPAMPAPPPSPSLSPPPPPSPPPSPPLPPPPHVAKTPNPYEGTPIRAQSCDPALNMKGRAPACAIRPAPGPTCESIGDTKAECPTLRALLKPRVAEAAIECLNRRSGTKDICEFNVSSICAYEALESACIEPYAKAACTKVMARCGPAPKGHYNKMTQDACEAGVSGVADAKRARFLSCISEACRFETCLTYM